ncbi:phage portal protein [Endobacter medicaginis]
MPSDSDLSPRCRRLLALDAVLSGSQYDHLRHAFSDEISGAGEYIPLNNRRPSVRTNLCRTVVDDSVSMLFSEAHFPVAHAPDARTAQALMNWVKERRLNELMSDAATRGSVGSVALLFRVLRGKPFVSVLPTATLTPTWDPEDPDSLVAVTERYKVRGNELRARGYSIPADADGSSFWFQRTWDADAETWYLPLSVSDARDGKLPNIDTDRTITHGLGFLPVIWVRNLPGGDEIDGASTFEPAISTAIECDYQLSQAGRGLKYASDPRLVIRDPGTGVDGGSRPITGGAANAIVLSDPQADARFLEINGSAATAVLEYVSRLRSIALESIHGNRADPERLSAAQSGRAMELLNSGLLNLADRLRTSYGEGALLSLYRMLCQASRKIRGGLVIAGERYADLDETGITLTWQPWFAPTSSSAPRLFETLR